jgi:hypothetical protein
MSSTASPIYIKSSGGGKRLYYPYNIKGRYTPLKGNLGKVYVSSSSGHASTVVFTLRPKPHDHAACPPPRNFTSHLDRALGLGFEAQPEKPSYDGLVAKPPNPLYTTRPYHAKLRARQTFHFRHPDSLLGLASFLDLAATVALATYSRLCLSLSLLAPHRP